MDGEDWLLNKLADRSHREDGHRCWHGIKPPLAHPLWHPYAWEWEKQKCPQVVDLDKLVSCEGSLWHTTALNVNNHQSEKYNSNLRQELWEVVSVKCPVGPDQSLGRGPCGGRQGACKSLVINTLGPAQRKYRKWHLLRRRGLIWHCLICSRRSTKTEGNS